MFINPAFIALFFAFNSRAFADSSIPFDLNSNVDLSVDSRSITLLLSGPSAHKVCGIEIDGAMAPGELKRISEKLEYRVAFDFPGYFRYIPFHLDPQRGLILDLRGLGTFQEAYVRIQTRDGESLKKALTPPAPTYETPLTARAEICSVRN